MEGLLRKNRLRVSFVHLDLGIGGAEQLVVNAASALKYKKHLVTIYTSHHDPDHCFMETKGNGRLARDIVVYGDWLPRNIFGKATAFCAIIRMMYISLWVCLSSWNHDVIFLDGVSAPIPLFRLFGLPVLFYCHFPDKLLCTKRDSYLKRLYRLPLDVFEEITTAMATEIVVNSKFTAEIFKDAFGVVGLLRNPKPLYPAINLASFVPPKAQFEYADNTEKIIVSLNRYERKKNIELALEAFDIVKKKVSEDKFSKIKLVIAGGYDERVTENVEYLDELKYLAKKLGIQDSVSFLTSITDDKRAELLQDALCLLYTPEKEHFGIVPLEAMYAGTPVIAVSSGGPLETVKHEVTGYLREGFPGQFAGSIIQLVNSPELKISMGKSGHEHVKDNFSLDAFGDKLENYIRLTYQQKYSLAYYTFFFFAIYYLFLYYGIFKL